MNRITIERKRLQLTQEELAEKLNISQKSISKYETGARKPTFETLTNMAKLFNVSTDYLLGLSDSRITFPQNNTDNSIIEKNALSISSTSQHFALLEYWQKYQKILQSIMTAKNISENDLINYVGITVNQKPDIDALIKISNLFNVSIDYLLGLSDIESQDLISKSKTNEATSKILATFQQLNGDNQDILIGEAKKLLKEQKLEKSVAADNSLQKTGTDNLGK